MNLLKAHNQWATRPADERFTSLADMHKACEAYRASAGQAKVHYASVRVEAEGSELKVLGKSGVPATLSNWAMGQLSGRAGAPASYLRSLPATLAAQNLNHGLKARGEATPEETTNLLFHKGEEGLVLRAALSDTYTRIWNSDLTGRLLKFQEANPQWKNPMAYKIRPTAGKQGFQALDNGFGTEMEPAGLYASDHDMFAFLVDEARQLDGSPKGLNRGAFIWNSEVGASSQGFMSFFYDRVCGNNIVWGASGVKEIRIRHTGRANEKSSANLQVELRRYADSDADCSEFEARVKAAKTYELGLDREEILGKLIPMVSKLKLVDLNKKKLEEALDVAESRTERYGNPNTLWATISGLTEASQKLTHMDERVKVDRAAGKLLDVISF